jgi:type VI secretion system protein ImpG
MPAEGSEDILPYYMAELAYLRDAGSDFARRYPLVADALDLSQEGSNDPQVQRLIEAFAFLTARLQRNYDAQLPEVPAALLDILYPQLTAPIPSMAIAAFVTDPKQSFSTAGVSVPRGTMLFADAEPAGAKGAAEPLTCRFQTGYPVTLWPVEVADVRLEPRSQYGYPFLDEKPDVQRILRIRMRCLGNRRFSEFSPPSLRFCLPPPNTGREAIYELLFTALCGIAVAPVADQTQAADVRLLAGTQVGAVGFDADEELLPCPPMSHQAYRLLQEYFSFPDKFLFFDVGPLEPGALGDGTETDLLLLLAAQPPPSVIVNAGSFALGCTPIINLFSRVTEPIRLDHMRLEYRLVADSLREGSTEIHSIKRVTQSLARDGLRQTIHPLLSFRHADAVGDGTALYIARRQPMTRADFGGSEMLLSFVDLDLNPDRPADDTVFAHVMCTNRGLAEQIGRDTRMRLEIDVPIAGVSCLSRPTRQVAPPRTGGTLWRLVSHLSVNHLSMTDAQDNAAVLREILLLYCPTDDVTIPRRISGLSHLATRRVVRHIGADAWRGFCRGTEITLEFDETGFAGASAWLLGAVLSRFFGLYAAVNTFTELVMKSRQREKAWRWPALTGQQIVL